MCVWPNICISSTLPIGRLVEGGACAVPQKLPTYIYIYLAFLCCMMPLRILDQKPVEYIHT